MTITLTFFFGLLIVSSFGRLGDLFISLRSTGVSFFRDTDFSFVPSDSATKDLGSSPSPGLKTCGTKIRQHPKTCEHHWDF